MTPCQPRGGLRFALLIVILLGAALGGARAGTLRAGTPVVPSGLCADAIQTAQARYAVPTGLLFAIGEVESGRPDPVTHRVAPWPWTVQAQNQSYYFASKAAAIQWVQAAQAKGIASIDIGCMQVNLMYHPNAFRTLDDAFDPAHNADYAARFLLSLHASTGDWQQASGLYHSETLALAIPYAQKVEDALNGRPWGGQMVALPAAPPKPTVLTMLQQAWGATLNSPATVTPVDATDTWVVPPPPAPRRHRLLRPWHRETPVLLSYAH
jgi:hypothetical protein